MSSLNNIRLAALAAALFMSTIVRAGDPTGDNASDDQHWAYRPLIASELPQVQDTQWPLTPVDRYVLQKLEEMNLQPAADAPPHDLARRVAFVLTGLPPTQEQMEAYQARDGRAALEGLIDALLASPRFGERWGRHWLDLARYADSNGLDENFLFREAWRYRNWVTAAVSDDMPFDRFLLEQIAGDLLPYDSIQQRDRQRVAAGFLVLGPKVLLGNKEPNQRMEVADELLDTIGRAVLGQTLGCARCHDHKFDPIPTTDYYAMAGIFTSTRVMEQRFMLGEQRVMERLVGLGENGHELDEAYEAYYRELPALRARKKKAEEALGLLKQARDELLTAEEVERFADALAKSALESSSTPEQRIAAQTELVDELSAKLATPPAIPPRAMIPADHEQPADEHVRVAGEFDSLGERVPRGFLTVLRDNQSEPPIRPTESGRIALSQWLCDGSQRSGQLTARVLANRIWHHLMGQGLVRTVDNFGVTGESPTHPELLDYLAGRLIESDWSVKSLVREIMLSHTFALSSQYDSTNVGVDPENRWLWKANRRRLDPESLRDAMLAAAGKLDLVVMDSTVWYLEDQATAVGANLVRRRTDFPCRSVYLPVIRNDLPEIFDAFDFANPQVCTGARPNTTAPEQALFIMNDEMVMDAAEATAQRILSDAAAKDVKAQIELMFQLIANSSASESAHRSVHTYLEQTENRLKADGVENAHLRAWTLCCHALFASSRFQFVD